MRVVALFEFFVKVAVVAILRQRGFEIQRLFVSRY